METINYIISPIAGAVIGYFTNWLAIKMLFKPHTEKRIGNMILPFTPGLIPKEKERIASKLGDTVGNYLLTEEALTEALTSREMIQGFEKVFDGGIDYLKNSNLTIEETLEILLKLDKHECANKIIDFGTDKINCFMNQSNLKKQVSDYIYTYLNKLFNKNSFEIFTNAFWNYMREFIKNESKKWDDSGYLRNYIESGIESYINELIIDERKLEDAISNYYIEGLKAYLAVKVPDLIQLILNIVEEDPEIELKLRNKIGEVVSQFAGPIMGMFVDADSIYDKVIMGIKEYIENSDNQPEIDEVVNILVDRITEFTISDIVNLADNEFGKYYIYNIAELLSKKMLDGQKLEEMISGCRTAFENREYKTLGDILVCIEPDYKNKIQMFLNEKIEKLPIDSLAEFINKYYIGWVKKIMKINISDLINYKNSEFYNRIKSFFVTGYEYIVKKAAPSIWGALDIPKIVEKQINGFSMEKTEDLIISIADKELRAITIVGGVLGFVIGFVPVMIGLF